VVGVLQQARKVVYMETRTLDKELINQFCKILQEIPDEDPVVAVVGRGAEYWPEAVTAAERCSAGVVLLEEDMPLHGYKRTLNEYDCRCLMYSQKYEELAYRINNDGVTRISEYIKIE
jgi:hypothetical protein